MIRGAPRIAPLTDDELDGDTRALLPRIVVDGAPTTGRSNVLRTLVRHRSLFPRWTPFLDGLLNGTLPGRDRELLVLRIASNCGCDYQWGQHVRVAQRIGLTNEEIRRTRRGPDAPEWDPADALLLRVADELHSDAYVSDPTWAALTGRYDEQQLIEIVMLVGNYQLVAMVVNSLRTPLDEGLPGLDDEIAP